MPGRFAVLAYGVGCYAVFFATFLYAIGFVGNVLVPTSIDGAPVGSTAAALAVNLGLLTLFALQHSVMARPAFERLWTRIAPEPMERSTYVLASSLALMLLFALWRPSSRPAPPPHCGAQDGGVRGAGGRDRRGAGGALRGGARFPRGGGVRDAGRRHGDRAPRRSRGDRALLGSVCIYAPPAPIAWDVAFAPA